MYDGFIKVSASTPEIRVADVKFNAERILEDIKTASQKGAKLIVFPELCLTAYTCGDLFYQRDLIKRAERALVCIAKETEDLDILSVIGTPIEKNGKLYNCGAFIKDGEILGLVTKSCLPNTKGFNELRYFNTLTQNTTVYIGGSYIPIGPKLLFSADEMPEFCIGGELCEDLYVAAPPSNTHSENGANIIVNLSASNRIVGKKDWWKKLVEVQSSKTISAYIYANAGIGESTTDFVFSGNNMIYEMGYPLSDAKDYETGIIYGDIDIEKILLERRRANTFQTKTDGDYWTIEFNTKLEENKLLRRFDKAPFMPKDCNKAKRCEEIFAIQCQGLKKRLSHINAKTVTIGISGGLDSTLAFLVTANTFKELDLPMSGIIAVTMPCFGTSDRTYKNALTLINSIGATFKEINIKNAVTGHLEDIGADINTHDVTYENAQARERTQILMDIANKTGGIVIGTGDLSELALGFATYNGDHMSMYGINASVPKTLMRDIVKYVADMSDDTLKATLYDILDTPVSPELLPPEKDGKIAQQTEEIVGPYELHDFFLYYMVRYGFSKDKILRIAENAFEGMYGRNIIEKWLNIFMKRFYNSQFKRSCLPDGVKVGTVGLSPRGDFLMPSDAVLNE